MIDIQQTECVDLHSVVLRVCRVHIAVRCRCGVSVLQLADCVIAQRQARDCTQLHGTRTLPQIHQPHATT